MHACRVGIQVPTLAVRYEHLSVEGEVHVGSRAIPTLLNAILNVIEVNHHATYLLKLEGITSSFLRILTFISCDFAVHISVQETLLLSKN